MKHDKGNMLPLSVVIITLNESRNIGRCLESVQGLADEIVVVDSQSTDDTAAIAERLGARVVLQPFLGYGAQKNFANQQASHDWILSLDADEALSPELRQSVLAWKEQLPEHTAYRCNRLTNYCGAWIRHCGWYPDTKVRLFDRNTGAWKSETLHEFWQPHAAEAPIGKISGDLLHYSFYTLNDHIRQIDRYTELAAQERAAKGKSYSRFRIWFGPKWTFLSCYIFRLGFLDGYPGYVVCRYNAYYTFMKYTKTRFYAKQKLR